MEQLLKDGGLDLRHPQEAAWRRTEELLRDSGEKRMVLFAASPLGIDVDQEINATILDSFDPSVRGRRYLSSNGFVVATRVESRETFAGLLKEEKEPSDPPPGSQPRDTSPLPSMDVVQRLSIRVRERLPELPWRAGTYLIDVIFDAQTSNRLRVTLTPGEAAAKDPEVAAYIERQRGGGEVNKEFFPAPVNGAKLPNYKADANSLPIPAAAGITLAADRVSVYKPDSHSVLKGSFRLPVPAAYYRGGTGDGGAATATVPITLVVNGNSMTGPFVSVLRVPSYDRVDKDAKESTVTGTFAVDLFALPELSKAPQTYTIRAYSGEYRSEPATAAFIRPEMLK